MGPVVVGLDGSATSRRAFGIAVEEATWRGASVVGLHVAQYPVMPSYGFAYGSLDSLRDAGRQFLDWEMRELRERYQGDFGVDVSSRLAVGHVGLQLMKLAERVDNGPAELVVLGSRGLGGFRGLLVGSTTTYAVHHLSCPVLVVPQVPEPEPQESV